MKKGKIYYTTDLHGYFYPTTYGNQITQNIGLFRCASHFQKDGDTIIIDNGDNLQGSAFTYYCRHILQTCKPIAEIMNACGYDYFVPGNHDFNYGMEYLEEYINSMNGRCLCQNLEDESHLKYPYDIKQLENGLRVGIVGIVTEFVNVWEKKENMISVSIGDAFLAAKSALSEMKDKVDISICVYHGGFERVLLTGEVFSNTKENVGYQIASELDFDILLTGHQHITVKGIDLNGTKVFQAKEYGKECIYIEIGLDEKGNVEVNSQLITADLEIDMGLEKKLAWEFWPVEKKVQYWLDQAIGRINRDLLPEDRVTMAMSGSPIASILNQIQLHYTGAQISAVALPNVITGFQKKVKVRDIIANYPYPNTLVVCEISGRQLKQVMERSAEYLEVNENDEIVVADKFLKPKEEHYNFDFYDGVTYRINPRNTVGNRIENLTFQGEKVENSSKFSICINNYRATGAGNYNTYKECKILKEINIEMVELIIDYFRRYPIE